MSPALRQVTARDVVRVALRLGFVFDRQSGSHAIYWRKIDRHRVVVPIHGNRTIKPGTFHSMLKDMGISREDFLRLVK